MSKIGIGDSAKMAPDVGGGATSGSSMQLKDIADYEDEEDAEEPEDSVIRTIFEDNLRSTGLETELEPSKVRVQKKCRVKHKKLQLKILMLITEL